jgi:hypothetical protein
MQKSVSSLIAALALAGSLWAIYWQVACADAAHFSFVFASAVTAIVCAHWLLEELNLVRAEPYRHLVHEV